VLLKNFLCDNPRNLLFLYGAGYGISMGYGSYSFMPIPYSLALIWFLGTVVELTIGGVLLGLIVKEESE